MSNNSITSIVTQISSNPYILSSKFGTIATSTFNNNDSYTINYNTFKDIEDRLAALETAKALRDLEDRWSELKDLGTQYRILAAELTKKEEMWKLLQTNK